MITIEQAANGFIVRNGFHCAAEGYVFSTLDEAFAKILFDVEGRSASGTDDAYGTVEIRREVVDVDDRAR